MLLDKPEKTTVTRKPLRLREKASNKKNYTNNAKYYKTKMYFNLHD